MTQQDDYKRFQNLDFEGFRELARDESLTAYEKIGFPNAYRAGYEEHIFEDIRQKLSILNRPEQIILDIGPGCTDLPHMLINLCREKNHQLILIDSQEMLDHLPDEPFITKLAGYYPGETASFISEYQGKVDAVLVYSVLHYVFTKGNIFDFMDKSLSLLANQGEMLIGDIPNISKRKRFFASQTGVNFHKTFMKTEEAPIVEHLSVEHDNIDDSVLFGLMQRARLAGFDSYLLPQADNLPMANRREDLLIKRP